MGKSPTTFETALAGTDTLLIHAPAFGVEHVSNDESPLGAVREEAPDQAKQEATEDQTRRETTEDHERATEAAESDGRGVR